MLDSFNELEYHELGSLNCALCGAIGPRMIWCNQPVINLALFRNVLDDLVDKLRTIIRLYYAGKSKVVKNFKQGLCYFGTRLIW